MACFTLNTPMARANAPTFRPLPCAPAPAFAAALNFQTNHRRACGGPTQSRFGWLLERLQGCKALSSASRGCVCKTSPPRKAAHEPINVLAERSGRNDGLVGHRLEIVAS